MWIKMISSICDLEDLVATGLATIEFAEKIKIVNGLTGSEYWMHVHPIQKALAGLIKAGPLMIILANMGCVIIN